MATIKKKTFSLPKEQTSYIERLVKSGAYASASEVVRAGLRSLQERDAIVEKWLRTEVVGTYDGWKAGKTTTMTADEVFTRIQAHHRRKTRKSA